MITNIIISTVLLAICQFTAQANDTNISSTNDQIVLDNESILNKIIGNPGWINFSGVQIKYNEEYLLYNDFKPPNNKYSLTTKVVNDIISCKYADVLLTYTILMDHLANACKAEIMELNEKETCTWTLYWRIVTIKPKTKFIQKFIDYFKSLDGQNVSFLEKPLQELYENSKNLKTLYLITNLLEKIVERMDFKHDFEQMTKSISTLQNYINNVIMKDFCKKQQTSPIPSYDDLKYKFLKKNDEPNSFPKFIDNYIYYYLLQSRISYFNELGFQMLNDSIEEIDKNKKRTNIIEGLL